MKTNTILIIIVSLLLTFGTQIKAQEYVPLAVDGAHWIVSYDIMETPPPMDALWEYHANGDTLVEDQTYLKVYRRELELNESFLPPFVPATEFELVGLLREDGEERKVYSILLAEQMSAISFCPIGEESLLFDFSLSVGDTASFCAMPGSDIFGDIEINAISPTMQWGLETRAYETSVGSYYEGIGSDYGLFEVMFAPLKSGNNRYVNSTFLEYYCRETPCEFIVSTEELHETAGLIIHPNPATTELWLQLPENTALAQAQIALYNSSGRLLYNAKPGSHFHKIDVAHLPKGLYLVRLWDGEKWYVDKLVVR
jgi:hypothetical protein